MTDDIKQRRVHGPEYPFEPNHPFDKIMVTCKRIRVEVDYEDRNGEVFTSKFDYPLADTHLSVVDISIKKLGATGEQDEGGKFVEPKDTRSVLTVLAIIDKPKKD